MASAGGCWCPRRSRSAPSESSSSHEGCTSPAVLLKELEEFRAKVTLAKAEEELDWRDRPQDDLVLTLAPAAWLGEQALPLLDERFEESTFLVLRD